MFEFGDIPYGIDPSEYPGPTAPVRETCALPHTFSGRPRVHTLLLPWTLLRYKRKLPTYRSQYGSKRFDRLTKSNQLSPSPPIKMPGV